MFYKDLFNFTIKMYNVKKMIQFYFLKFTNFPIKINNNIHEIKVASVAHLKFHFTMHDQKLCTGNYSFRIFREKKIYFDWWKITKIVLPILIKFQHVINYQLKNKSDGCFSCINNLFSLFPKPANIWSFQNFSKKYFPQQIFLFQISSKWKF